MTKSAQQTTNSHKIVCALLDVNILECLGQGNEEGVKNIYYQWLSL
jgi:hypothetical protein